MFFDDVLDGFVKFGPLNVIRMSSSPSTHQTYNNSMKNLSDRIQVHIHTSVRTILKFFCCLEDVSVGGGLAVDNNNDVLTNFQSGAR